MQKTIYSKSKYSPIILDTYFYNSFWKHQYIRSHHPQSKKSVLRHSPTALRQPAIPASLTLFLSTARCSATLVTPPIGFLNYSISISSRGQITFVATSKSSSSIVHSSRSGSAESNLPVIPSKAPFSTLT